MKKYSLRMIIRRYVLGLLNSHPNVEIRIPSYNVLAKQFGMARATAQAELKALVDEGYLITKPGIGTFANVMRVKDSPPAVIVTMLYGNGDYVFDNYYVWALKSFLGIEIAKFPASLQSLTLSVRNNDNMLKELINLQTSALVWIDPPADKYEMIREIAKRMPVLTVLKQVDEVPSICWNNKPLGYQIGRELVHQKRFRFMYLESAVTDYQFWNGFVQAYAEAGHKLDNRFLLCYEGNHANVEALLSSGFRPDAVFFHDADSRYTLEVMNRYQIDLNDECRLVSVNCKPYILKAPMLLAELPFQEFARLAAVQLFQILDGAPLPERHVVYAPELDLKII